MSRSIRSGESERHKRRGDETDDFEHVDYKPNLRKMIGILSDLIPAVQLELDSDTHETILKSENSELKAENDNLKKEVKELENECKTLFEEKSKAQDDMVQANKNKHLAQKKYDDEIFSLRQSIDDLQNQLSSLKTVHGDRRKRTEEEDRYTSASLKAKVDIESYEKMQKQLQLAQKQLRKTKEELDDTKSRLSRQIGGKLTDNNPNIADLSDKNRPTKISERYQELYDNQWTDAYEILDLKYHDEKKTVSTLVKLLLDCMSYCQNEADYQMQQLRTVLAMSQDKPLPTNIHKQMKDCRKELAECSVVRLYEDYRKHLRESDPGAFQTATSVPLFFKECFEICWLMAVQDPPLEFGPITRQGDPLKKDHYKPYTRSGDTVDFIVWPVLLLYKDGPVLFKGIAQCYGEIRRVKSAPTRRIEKISGHAIHSGSKSTVAGRFKPDHTNSTPIYERPYGQTTVRTQHAIHLTEMYDNQRHEERLPTNEDLDRYIYLTETYGSQSARAMMGKTYDICLRYLI